MAESASSALEVRQVDRSLEPVLRTLLGYYCHDMAEWFGLDAGEDGAYSYPTGALWDAGRSVHLAYLDRIPIGFALVGPPPDPAAYPGASDLREFFVVRRHRRSGIGRTMAAAVWREHPGPWLVRVFHGNRLAVPFWRAAIHAYTDGRYSEQTRRVDDRHWAYFSFESTV